MVFNPYTVEQLQKILADRVKLAFSDDAISGGAINLCAAMAGKENGDARKAIDLLRVAAEIAERERLTNVEEKHIRLAQEKIEKDTNYEVLKNSTTHTKIVCSLTGSASMSVRSITTGPVPLRNIPTTPVWPTSSVTS